MIDKKLGKDFWLFRAGQIISQVGNQLAFIAIAFYILNKTGSAVKMSMVIVPATLIRLFLALFLSPLADHFERKSFIIYGNLIKAISWAVIVAFIVANKLSIIVLTCFYMVSAFGTSIDAVGSSGFLPDIVSKQNLQKASQVITGTNSVIKIVGGMCAGLIVGILGISVSLTINAATFLCVMITAILIKPKFCGLEKKEGNNGPLVFFSWKKKFYEGINYAFRKKELIILFATLFFIQFIIVPMQIAIPVFVKNSLHQTESFFGILISAEGVGAIFAAGILGFLSGLKKDRIILFGFFISSLGFFLLSEYPNKLLSLVFVFLISMGMTGVGIVFNSSLMRIIHEKYRSRFFTLIYFAEGIAVPLSLFFAGYLIDVVGVLRIFLYISISLLALIFLLFYFKVFSFLFESN